jgi:hypothetical protein
MSVLNHQLCVGTRNTNSIFTIHLKSQKQLQTAIYFELLESDRELIKEKLRYNVSLKLLPCSFSLGDTGTPVIYYVLANENLS